MTHIKHFAVDANSNDVVAALINDGAAIIDDVISATFIDQLRAETDPYMDATENGFDEFTGFLTTRTGGLLGRSSS